MPRPNLDITRLGRGYFKWPILKNIDNYYIIYIDLLPEVTSLEGTHPRTKGRKMHFNARKYDRANAVSLLSLALLGLSLVYFVIVAAVAAVQQFGGDGTMTFLTSHIVISFAVVVGLAIIAYRAQSTYERLDVLRQLIKDLIAECEARNVTDLQAVDLTPSQDSFHVSVARVGGSYMISVVSGPLNRWLSVSPTSIRVGAVWEDESSGEAHVLLTRTSQQYARAILGLLRGDGAAVRKELDDARALALSEL